MTSTVVASPRRALLLGAATLLAALAVGGLAVPRAAAATVPAPPVSSIRSATLHSCLDVATTDPAHNFDDTYGHRCDGSATQAFAFRTLSSAPPGTYEIVSQASGNCLDQYRFGIRQESCTGAVPPDFTNVQWTLQRVGRAGHRYRLVETTTLSNPTPDCVQVRAEPNGYPGPLFELTACDPHQSAQVLTLTAAP